MEGCNATPCIFLHMSVSWLSLVEYDPPPDNQLALCYFVVTSCHGGGHSTSHISQNIENQEL